MKILSTVINLNIICVPNGKYSKIKDKINKETIFNKK
jgi:hypothetical protein